MATKNGYHAVRLGTGIVGLDKILQGGLPAGQNRPGYAAVHRTVTFL
jgi:hypothetical protein